MITRRFLSARLILFVFLHVFDTFSKAVEKEDNGVSFTETIAMIDGLNNKNSSFPDGTTSGLAPSSTDVMSSPSFSAVTSKESSGLANSEELNSLKKNLQDVQAISESREKHIAEVSLSTT